MKNTIQLNVRIDGKLRNGHRLVAAVSQESVDGLTEAALKFFYGSKDPTPDGVPTRERILIAVGAFTVGLFVLIVQYWLVAAIFDIADALRSGSNPFTSQGK